MGKLLSVVGFLFVVSCTVTNGFSNEPSPSQAWAETHR